MDISSLPDHQQIVVVMLVLVVSGVWAVTKFLKPFIDSITPKPVSAPGTADAVVISGAFADSKPIKELTESVDRLNGNIEELILCQRSGNMEARLLVEAMTRLNHRG